MARFTVDTHLFRELGELLVGRESTALVELIKNAYDADATHVTVHGESLHDPKLGRIVISDNGVGMTLQEFEDGFLRIASRIKEQGRRTSIRFNRRFTGAKGIGRLAAHKLARFVRIYSVPSREKNGFDRVAVNATIDWDIVENYQTLEELEGSGAIQLSTEPILGKAKPGTTIELERLRKRWSPAERARFFAEVQTFSPPRLLIELPSKAIDFPLLFNKPNVYDCEPSDPGFDISLTGEFEAGEEYWQTLVQAAQWLIDIDASRPDRKIRISIVPTKRGRNEFPASRQQSFTMDHLDPISGPFFQARVLIREGPERSKDERVWLGKASGIRVYMEGFRVLPYGEPKDDWLSIDADYARRSKTLPLLSDLGFAGNPADEEEGLQFLRKNAYFGAVFLTLAGAPKLRMIVNREGFIPDQSYEDLAQVVRTAIYLSVRVRAAAKRDLRDKRSEARRAKSTSKDDIPRVELRKALSDSIKIATAHADEAKKLAAKGDFEAARNRIAKAAEEFSETASLSDQLLSEGGILRVLASVGMQMAAFVHEINSLLGGTAEVESHIAEIRKDPRLPTSLRSEMAKLQAAMGDLRRSVERQASYLTDVVSPDARRRRSRQSLHKRFESGRNLVDHLAQRRGISISNKIPEELKSPPMFPAELTVIFSNLLTNAVKAAGEKGRILAHGNREDDGGVVLRVENTGVAVEPEGSEHWFKPFESTTVEADPVLGQGMGMGLPITRNMLEEYGATIRFVRPSAGFSTALEIRFQD